MAYLYKHTPLAGQRAGQPHLPGAHRQRRTSPRRSAPRPVEILSPVPRLPLRDRDEAARSSISASCGERIHVLEGFEKVFDALDEVIQIIRQSEGREDAHEKLMTRFGLSDEQTEAILELRLYRLAKLEILLVQKELGQLRAEAKKLEALLKSADKRWALVKDELRRAARQVRRRSAARR